MATSDNFTKAVETTSHAVHLLGTAPMVANIGFTATRIAGEVLKDLDMSFIAEHGIGAMSGITAASCSEAVARKIEGPIGNDRRFIMANVFRVVSIGAGVVTIILAGTSIILTSGGIALVVGGVIGGIISTYKRYKYRKNRDVLLEVFKKYNTGDETAESLVDTLLNPKNYLSPEQALDEFEKYFNKLTREERKKVALMPQSQEKTEAKERVLTNMSAREDIIEDLRRQVLEEQMKRAREAARQRAIELMDMPPPKWWEFLRRWRE